MGRNYNYIYKKLVEEHGAAIREQVKQLILDMGED